MASATYSAKFLVSWVESNELLGVGGCVSWMGGNCAAACVTYVPGSGV